MIAPTLIGERLRLRPHVAEDMEAFWAFFQSDRALYIDAPENPSHMWYGFGAEVGSWTLYGMGGWAIEVDGALAGQVAVCQPPHYAEPEIGWLTLDGYEGRGLAFEAASLALDDTRSNIRPKSLVSYIHKDNARSISLVERLGAMHDPKAKAHDADDLVYRHEVKQ